MTSIVPLDSVNNMPFGKEVEMQSLFKECYDFSYRNWAPWLTQATDDLGFVLGNQWSAGDRAFLRSQKRNVLTFNKTRRIIKMVTGYERKSRHSLIASPVEGSDEKTASQMSALMLYIMNAQEMHHTMSDAFEGALKCGINLVELSLSFEDDPVNGDILMSRVPYNAVLIDPRFTKRDLKDAEYIVQRQQLDREAVKALLPFAADEIEMLPQGDRDDKFPFMQSYADSRQKEVMMYDQFWVRKFKDVKMLLDRETGQTIELETRDIKPDRLKVFLRANPSVEVVNRSKPTVEMNVFVNNQLMFSGEDPLGIGDFPHVPVMAFWDPEYADQSGDGNFALKLQSLVRCVRDSNVETNKFRSKMIDMMESTVNTGWQVKSNAVVNPKDLYQSGQGKVVWMQDHAQMSDAIPIRPPEIPQSMFQMAQLFDQDMPDIAGVSEELLGQPDNQSQISGETVKMRQGAALTVLQDLFDNFRLAQKLVGKKIMKMAQANYDANKVKRIINEDPTEEFYEKDFGKYDVSVEEAVETPTQRALFYQQILQAQAAGVLPDTVAQKLALEYLPIQKKDEIMAEIEALQEQSKAQEAKVAEQEALTRQLSQSKMFSDIGLGVERIARAEADRGLAAERISEMQENNASAFLKRAQAVAELEGMETDNLIKLISFAKQQEQENIQEAQVIQQLQTQLSTQQFNAGLDFVTTSPVQPPAPQQQGPQQQGF